MERFFRRLGLLIVNRRSLVILIGLILIGVAGFGVTRITIATGTETWVSKDSQVYEDYQRFSEHFGGSPIVVLITGDNISQLLQADNLKGMETVENRLGADSRVISAIGPAFLIKQAVAQQTGMPALPQDPRVVQGIIIDPQSGQIRPEFRGILPDDTHVLIPIVLKAGMSPEEKKAVVGETEQAVAAANFVGVEAVVTGEPVLTSQLEDLVANSLAKMMIVGIVLMFVILALIFGVRGFFAWRWLPLGMVGIGIIYAFGAMGILSIPISMVSMGVFPILLGLGIDYSINLHNRYDEESSRGKSLAEAVVASITHIGPAIAFALFSVCLGFAAMLLSPVPMIRDFGLVVIIGTIVCYIVAIFFTLLIVYWRDSRGDKRAATSKIENKPGQEGMGLIDRGLQRLVAMSIKNPVIIIPIGIGLAVAGLVGDSHIRTETDMANIISEDVPVMKNYQTLEIVAGGVSTASLLIEAEDVTEPGILGWIVQTERRIGIEMGDCVSSTRSVGDLVLQANGGEMPTSSEQAKYCLERLPTQLKKNLISGDFSAANLIVGIREFDVDLMKQMRAQLADYASDHPEGVNVSVTGPTIVESEMFEGMGGGRLRITLIGVGLVFLAVLIAFRFRLLKAVMAVLPIGLVIGWTSGIMYLAGIKYNPLTICLAALIMGIGVEYTILYMMRYFEERGKGEGPAEAMTTAVTRVGRAIVASGITTVGGFAALLFSGGFLIIRDFGLVTLVAVFFALVSALVVHPPMVVVVDSWLERRRLAKVVDTMSDTTSGD